MTINILSALVCQFNQYSIAFVINNNEKKKTISIKIKINNFELKSQNERVQKDHSFR